MTTMRRIGTLDLTLGTPLDFDLFDSSGRLLLRRGQIVANTAMVDELVRRGASRYSLESDEAGMKRLYKRNASLPAFDSLTEMLANLQRILLLAPNPAHLQESIMALAGGLLELCTQEQDAAIASIALGAWTNHSVKHQLDTAIAAEAVAKAIDMPRAARQSLVCASLTMNMSLLDLHETLNQRNGPIQDGERAAMQSHPQATFEILQAAGVRDQEWLDAVRYHHESIDGSGYLGMVGDQVSLAAQVLRICDMYTARVTRRNWAATEKSNLTLVEILRGLGKFVRADVATSMVRALGIFPPGNHVLLENGEIGVVIRRGKDAKSPVVASYISPSGLPLGCPIHRDTSVDQFHCVAIVDPPKADVQLSPKALWGLRERLESGSSLR
ncbi:MAG: hypothetical protein IPK50_22805 [Fibrobacterota bacterium]|nr:MAG: hypothetical protein IPK50_22805 [Fibrobacterota bacterium]